MRSKRCYRYRLFVCSYLVLDNLEESQHMRYECRYTIFSYMFELLLAAERLEAIIEVLDYAGMLDAYNALLRDTVSSCGFRSLC